MKASYYKIYCLVKIQFTIQRHFKISVLLWSFMEFTMEMKTEIKRSDKQKLPKIFPASSEWSSLPRLHSTLFQQNCLSSQNRQICSPGSCSNVNVLTCKCLWNKDEQFILIYIYFKYMDVLPVYVPGPCVWCPPRPEEGIGVPETRVTDSGESLAYWELNMGLLRSSQCSLFTAEPPLQPPVIYSF